MLDVTLRAGDTLYLPRGWLHEALTSDTDSLHLTVGVNVTRGSTQARAALDECADDVELRRSGRTIDARRRPARALAERLDAGRRRAARARERFVRSRRPILDGQLSELRALDVADRGRRRSSGATTVIADLDGTTLVLRGQARSRFPERLATELEFARHDGGAVHAPRELPGELDDEGRLVLVRRLMREGFLRRSAAAA